MDKYQEFILNRCFHSGEAFVSEKLGRQSCGKIDIINEKITIVQDEDIFSKVYKQTLKLRCVDIKGYRLRNDSTYFLYRNKNCKLNKKFIICVSVTYDGLKWVELPFTDDNEEAVEIVLDFDNRIKQVKFSFEGEYADDFIMDVEYIEADKEKYYIRKKDEEIKALISAAAITTQTGENLVNIYFKPCCEKYHSAEIQLYAVTSPDNLFLIDKYKLENDSCYKSIGGLAYGQYMYILKQFDSKGNVLIQSDNIKFTITRPQYQRDFDL